MSRKKGEDEEKYLKAIASAKAFFLARPPGELLPVITDAANTFVSEKIRAAPQDLKDATDEHNKGYDVKNIRATIGIGGVKKLIADIIARDVRFFDTFDEAAKRAVAEAKTATG